MGFIGPKTAHQRVDQGTIAVASGVPGLRERITPREKPPIDKRDIGIDPKFQQPMTTHFAIEKIVYGEQLITRKATGDNTDRQGDFVAVRRGNDLRIMRQPSGKIILRCVSI